MRNSLSNRCWINALLCLCCLAGVIALRSQPACAAEFRAGAHAMDITPTAFPISVNGSMSDVQATGAHDPLHARCLVLDDGTSRFAFVVCDSCMIPREVADEAKRLAHELTRIPTQHILISATHTHSAVTVTGVFQSEPNVAYQQFFVERIAHGIEKAISNLRPVKIGWGGAANPHQVFNRRWKMKSGTVGPDPFGRLKDTVRMNPGNGNPNMVEQAGTIDPEVSVLSVRQPDGTPIAVLANYSLHYVGNIGGAQVSADYYGAFAERLTQLLAPKQTNPPFVAIMSNATSGDINNIDFRIKSPPRHAPFEKIRLVAESVARSAAEAETAVKYQDSLRIDVRERELELGVRPAQPGDLARAEMILAKAKKTGGALRTLDEIYARETVLLKSYPPTVRLKLQAIRLGDLAIVAIPCEVFAEIGLHLKSTSPFAKTFTIELANGYNGYLPTPGQHQLGGYETWRARSSYLEEQASVKIIAQLTEMLKELHAAK